MGLGPFGMEAPRAAVTGETVRRGDLSCAGAVRLRWNRDYGFGGRPEPWANPSRMGRIDLAHPLRAITLTPAASATSD